jgi:hypothetical protein
MLYSSARVKLDKAVLVLNYTIRHEDVWESGGIDHPILSLGSKWKSPVRPTSSCSVPRSQSVGDWALQRARQDSVGRQYLCL